MSDSPTTPPDDRPNGDSAEGHPSGLPVIVESPYRPFPLSAKQALKDELPEIQFAESDQRTAYATDTPSDDLCEQWELSVDNTEATPLDVWETDRGRRVEIYDGIVTVDGRDTNLSPDEAKEQARTQDHFTRIK